MRFGILSTANIGDEAVVPAIRSTNHDVQAVASRSADAAAAYADRHGIPETYDSYDALLGADIDAAYIPLPNGLHAEWTKRAADAGLDVLCEKPLASDTAEAVDVVEHCEDAGVTLMEAFMYRYHPRTVRAVEVAREHLGDLRHVHAEFSFQLGDGPDVRLDPDLAGGALMDVGCYPVSAARTFLGEPALVSGHTHDRRGAGVDTEVAATFEFDDGATATIEAGFETGLHQRYRVEGTDGWLETEDAFNPGQSETVLRWGTDEKTVEETFDPVDAYEREIEHFAASVDGGRDPLTDGNEAIANMRAIDAIYESSATGDTIPL